MTRFKLLSSAVFTRNEQNKERVSKPSKADSGFISFINPIKYLET
jgi:hypothetical protein